MSGEENGSVNGFLDWTPADRSRSVSVYAQRDRVDPVDVDGDGFTEVTRRRLATAGLRWDQFFFEGRGRLAGEVNRIREDRRGGDRLHLPPEEARIDDHSEVANPIASPRAALMWSPNPQLTVRTSLARGFRPPVVFDEDLHISLLGGGQAQLIRNDPGLSEETSTNAMMSLSWYPTVGRRGLAAIELALFRTDIDDLFHNLETDDPRTPDRLELTKVNLGSARVQGAELNLSFRWSSRLSTELGLVRQTARFDRSEPDFGSRDFFRSTVGIAVAILMGGSPAMSGSKRVPSTPREATTFWEVLAPLEDLSGRRWGSEQLAGQVVLVDFWATWCAPCRAEVPTLRTAYRRFRERGFQILGVALDRGERRDLESWLRRQRVTWPQIHERRGFDSPVARHFGVESLPRSFLLDRRGRRIATDLRGEALLAVLSALFAQPRGVSEPHTDSGPPRRKARRRRHS